MLKDKVLFMTYNCSASNPPLHVREYANTLVKKMKRQRERIVLHSSRAVQNKISSTSQYLCSYITTVEKANEKTKKNIHYVSGCITGNFNVDVCTFNSILPSILIEYFPFAVKKNGQ
jgi:hypothetical protein